MNCTKCGYLLFGLPQCRCPECGTEFKTTDYGFPPGAIHFLCPYCQQTYLGTDVYGLPTPRVFTCVNCRRSLNAATMSVRPIREGAMGEQLRFGSPWELRDRIGFARAFLQTMTQIMLQPGDFFRRAQLQERWTALTFSVFASAIGAVPLTAVFLVINSILVGTRTTPTIAWTYTGFVVVRNMVLLALFMLAWAHLFGLGLFLALAAIHRDSADYDACVQIVAYASAALPAFVLPPAGLAWYAWIIVSGVRDSQGLSQTRAVIATVLPLLAALNAALLIYIV